METWSDGISDEMKKIDLKDDFDEQGVTTKGEHRAGTAVLNESNQSARLFADADADGDQALDFDEFYAMQPAALRAKTSVDDIRKWFDSADIDGSGRLSIDEFFLWSLNNAVEKHGDIALENVFSKYDPDRTGSIDMHEFQRACDDTGFGLVASKIFDVLDPDNSGSVSYKELIASCRRGAVTDVSTKSIITGLIHSYDAESTAQASRVQGMVFSIHADTMLGVQTQIQQLLADSGANVIDLIKLFDQDADRGLLIDHMEFNAAMRQHFGFVGSLELIDRIFTQLDSDGSGKIGFDELYEFIRGKRHSLDYRNKRVRDMVMTSADAGVSLEKIEWSSDVLRILMLQMMERCHVSSSDLITAWDKQRDGMLSEAEFCSNLKKVFTGNDELWKAELRALSVTTFIKIARKAGDSKVRATKLDVVELDSWLQAAPAGWESFAPPLKNEPSKAKAPEPAKAKAPEPAEAGASSCLPRDNVLHTHPSARLEEEVYDKPLVIDTSGGPFILPASMRAPAPPTGVMASTGAPRYDVSSIIQGHADFWSMTKSRMRSRRLPPVSPRANMPQPIVASLPRNRLPYGSPRPKSEIQIGSVPRRVI